MRRRAVSNRPSNRFNVARVRFVVVVGLSNVVEWQGCQGSMACVDQFVGKRDAGHQSCDERRTAKSAQEMKE